MRKLIILLLLPVYVSAQIKPKEFTVTVKLDSIIQGEKFYFEYAHTEDPDNPEVTDSTIMNGDKLVFKGKITEPFTARLYRYKFTKVDSAFYKNSVKALTLPKEQIEEMLSYFLNPMKQESFEFFLLPGETTIKAKDNLYVAKAEGVTGVAEFAKLKKDDREYIERRINMMEAMLELAAYSKKDTAYQEKARRKHDSLNKRMLDEVYLGFVRSNPNSPVALYALKSGMPHQVDSADKYLNLLSTINPETRQWPSAIRLVERLEAIMSTEIGRKVAEFQQLDELDKTIKFSSFSGKYVLLELWASWCGPCRQKNPELVKTFAKYSKEKFTILGIALERKEDKDKWLAAIKKDNLTWPQVTDYKFWNNAVAKQFGVNAIPFNLLVDPNGKIIGKNLYGKELDEKLRAIFNQ